MDSWVLLLILFLLVIVMGALLGGVSFFKLKQLSRRVEELEAMAQRRQSSILPERRKTTVSREKGSRDKVGTRVVKEAVLSDDALHKLSSTDDSEPEDRAGMPAHLPQEPAGVEKASWFSSLRDNWMIWLGGACVGLAGIFLVKYSIDSGLLGPKQRIVLAVSSGIGLHGLADWLRRRTGETHPAFAALAGGASIILYAAMLAALHLYHLLGPQLVFIVLAVISVLTMLLALRYGPVLAIIGILGAYVVPVLVSSNSGNIVGAMIYSLIISGTALLLMRYVYRPWLWFGMLAGGLGWWLISCLHHEADGFRGFYLAALAYAVIAIPLFDWGLKRAGQPDDPGVEPFSLAAWHSKWQCQPMQLTLGLIIVGQAVSIALEGFSGQAILSWFPLPAVILLAGRNRASISWLPWFSLFVQWFAWLYCGLDFDHDRVRLVGFGMEMQKHFLLFAFAMAGLYSTLTWWCQYKRSFSHLRSSLLFLAPLLWLALCYLLVTDLSASWRWSLGTFLFGIVYLFVAGMRLEKEAGDGNAIWLMISGHFALSLAMTMYFREATLTLALATQTISLAWIIRRYSVSGLEWLVKGVLAIVVTRLTLNPWLLNYPSDVHWSLWSYGGAAACCGLAAWMSEAGSSLRKWLEAVALQLFVLFCVAETRYRLYDGQIFVHDYSLLEAAINSVLWSALGLVYSYRSRLNSALKRFYLSCSHLLLLLSLINYIIVLTLLNPLWSNELVSPRPIWNLLLLAYGAPVIMAGLVYYFFEGRFKQVASFTAGIGLLVFVSLEIRHLWHGALDLDLPFRDGELYTYSIVWLILAVTTILLATRVAHQGSYKAGMALLLVVIAKIFLVDMSDLEGLLRVASFMGLGLSLLGLAYLYQRMTRRHT